MGVVWQAVHVVTRKTVALKFLKRNGADDDRAVQRFLREARAACAVHHPSVVEVHDVLELEDGSSAMVMELLKGETFARRLAREPNGGMPLAEVARIMVHVCSAVGCAHGLGIVHRDLKPENIFLADAHGALAVKVLDFGIAKLTATEGDAAQTGANTGTGAILGTPYYMAPEQLFGEKDIDHRADLWALGIIFYEALSGTLPTQQPNIGQIIKLIITDGIVPLKERAPNLPDDMVEIVDRLLARDRAARPRDVGEVLGVLARFTDEQYVPVTSPAFASRTATAPDALASAAALPVRQYVIGGGEPNGDTARASTYDAAGPGGAAGAPSRKRSPRPLLLVATVAVAGGGALAVGTHRDAGFTKTVDPPAVLAAPSPSASSSAGAASGAEPLSAVPAAPAPSLPPTVVRTTATASPESSGASPRAAVRPQTSRGPTPVASTMPRGAQGQATPEASTPRASPPGASSAPPAVDPGSYM
jgi:serine/threonine-protein kinase